MGMHLTQLHVLASVVMLYGSLCGNVFGELPDYIKPCHGDDPEIAQCIIRAIEELRPRLKSGIPELDVPSIEPLHLDEIRLTQGIQCNVTNLEVWGASAFEITEISAEIPKNRFAFVIKLPFLQFNGHYNLNSRILVVTLKGNGPINGNFTDYTFAGTLKGKRIQDNGKEYLKFDKMKLTIYRGKTEMKLENLFNNNPTLAQATNSVLNDSNDAILEQVLPALTDSLSEFFTNIANKITLKFTYKELFL